MTWKCYFFAAFIFVCIIHFNFSISIFMVLFCFYSLDFSSVSYPLHSVKKFDWIDQYGYSLRSLLSFCQVSGFCVALFNLKINLREMLLNAFWMPNAFSKEILWRCFSWNRKSWIFPCLLHLLDVYVLIYL